MKKIIHFLIFNAIVISGISQSSGLSFNSILRDNSGNPVVDTEVDIEIAIYQGDPLTGQNIYSEEYNGYQTNFLGLINLKIGEGDSTSFNSINWSNPPYFLEVIVDGIILNSSEILHVPLALYAVYGEDEDANSTNELLDSVNLIGNNLNLYDACSNSVLAQYLF